MTTKTKITLNGAIIAGALFLAFYVFMQMDMFYKKQVSKKVIETTVDGQGR